MDILTLLLGIAMGAGSTYLIFKNRKGVPKEQFDALNIEKTKIEERAKILDDNLRTTNGDLEEERKRLIERTTSLATAQSELKGLGVKFEDYKKEVQDLQKQFSAEFKNLANDILEEKTQKFTEINSEKLGALLDPLNEKIKDFEKTINSTYAKEASERSTLAEQIRALTELNQQITKEASNLTTALKGQSKAQGDWGELILEQILERSGLVKGTHYFVQKVMQGEDGKSQKPDIIINLPDNKQIIVDSKVSLTAYTEYCKSENVESQRTLLNDHLSSIRKHIKELSEKKYQNIYQLQSVDFVLIFIPLEPAFAIAVKNDINLFNEAYEKNIVIVTASTLIATLRTIANIWRQENQSRNAIEIARKSGSLYDKFVGFLDDMKSIGAKLQDCQKSYDGAMNKLTEGRGNIIRSTEELKTMGAKTTKVLPTALVDKSLESEQQNDLLNGG